MIFQVDKQEVFASDGGKGIDVNKDTIILLHGSGLSHIVWSLTEQYLSNQDCNVLSLDLPGHGNSDGQSLKSVEDMADWLKKVIIKIGIKNFSLAGHSQGCLVALEYSFKYPSDVNKLIFIAGSYEIPVNQSLIKLAESGNLESLNLMMKWGYGSSKQFIGGNPLQKILNSAREVREVLAVDLVACNNYKNGVIAAKRISCPTLFIFGELDKMIKIEKGKEFYNFVKDSKIHIIKNCGHMIIFEKAFEMRNIVKEFILKIKK